MDNYAVARALMGRGGSRQRVGFLGHMPEVMPPEVGKSPLADALLFLFSWGMISMPVVNWLAKCAIEGDPNHPDLQKLAGLGAGWGLPGEYAKGFIC